MMPVFAEFNIYLERENALPAVRKPWKDSPYKSNTSWYGMASGFQIFLACNHNEKWTIQHDSVCIYIFVCACVCKLNFTKIMFYKIILNFYMECILILSLLFQFSKNAGGNPLS